MSDLESWSLQEMQQFEVMIDLESCKHVHKDDLDYDLDSVYLSKSCWEPPPSRPVPAQGPCRPQGQVAGAGCPCQGGGPCWLVPAEETGPVCLLYHWSHPTVRQKVIQIHVQLIIKYYIDHFCFTDNKCAFWNIKKKQH